MKFWEVIELITTAYQCERDAIRSLQDLARYLCVNFSDMHEHFKIEELTAARYMQWQKAQPGREPKNGSKAGPYRAVRTQCNYFWELRRIYQELQNRGLIDINPFLNVKAPKGKRPKWQTRALSPSEVQRIFERTSCFDRKGRRDRAVLAVLFGGGLRIGEVERLNLSDFWRSEHGYVLDLVDTKSGDDAQQLLPDWAGEMVAEWVQDRIVLAEGDPNSALFCSLSNNKRGNRLKSAKMRRFCFAPAINRAGIKGWISTHSARATAITQLLNQGLTHRDVMAFSRHKSVAMVELYDKRRLKLSEHPGKKLLYGT